QLKTLSAENAEMTARHLAMVAYLAEQDPELAHRHAQAAASRAGRIPVVRETVGITAYFVEDWALSLRELLAHRRMTNSNDHVPMMIDCERGLGRPQRGLEMGRTVDRAALSADVRVSLAIAMSGARLDLGQNETALVELEIKELNPNSVFDYSPRLFWAYADTLEVLGREADAAKWQCSKRSRFRRQATLCAANSLMMTDQSAPSGQIDQHATVIALVVMVIAHGQQATVLNAVLAHRSATAIDSAVMATDHNAVLAHRNAMVTARHVIQIDHVVTQIDHSAAIRTIYLAETQNAQTVTLHQETTAHLAPIQHRLAAKRRQVLMHRRSHS
ncbi:MAG: hypothetical protein RI919_1060, partial [Actinomycetota bacterium]